MSQSQFNILGNVKVNLEIILNFDIKKIIKFTKIKCFYYK